MMVTKGKVGKLLRVGERAIDGPDAGKNMDGAELCGRRTGKWRNPSWPLEKKMPPSREKTLN